MELQRRNLTTLLDWLEYYAMQNRGTQQDIGLTVLQVRKLVQDAIDVEQPGSMLELQQGMQLLKNHVGWTEGSMEAWEFAMERFSQAKAALTIDRARQRGNATGILNELDRLRERVLALSEGRTHE